VSDAGGAAWRRRVAGVEQHGRLTPATRPRKGDEEDKEEEKKRKEKRKNRKGRKKKKEKKNKMEEKI